MQPREMGEKIKILVCGDIEGRFNTLFKKIDTINKKSGPFDLLICVGNFFGINNKEFDPYKTGDKKVPIPTVILGANSEDHVALYSEQFVEICENVQYLGKRGMYVSSNGLKIAYLSGISIENATEKKDYQYNDDEVVALRDICLRGNANFRGVDILLTAQWPTDVTNGDIKWNVETVLTSPSHHCAWLATQLRPRYHISGMEGIFFERAPFRVPNPDLEIPTRFLGLARVGNANKDRWLYALSVTPIEKMRITDLLQKTIDETKCPFNIEDLDSKVLKKRKNPDKKQQYFYDMTASDEKSDKRKFSKKQKVEFDQSKCWFCLASPSVEKHLIITVGNTVYLALAKGGMVEEHILICPIEHYQCSINQPQEVQQEVERFKAALVSFYGRDDKVPVFFERNYKTSHMQIQAVPIPKNAAKELSDIFKDEGEANGISFLELEEHSRIDQVLPAKVPYFTVQLPNEQILYTKIQGNKGFPLNFAREVLAMGPILDMPDRVEWKDCVLTNDAEIKLVERIRTDFEPFDITDD